MTNVKFVDPNKLRPEDSKEVLIKRIIRPDQFDFNVALYQARYDIFSVFICDQKIDIGPGKVAGWMYLNDLEYVPVER